MGKPHQAHTIKTKKGKKPLRFSPFLTRTLALK